MDLISLQQELERLVSNLTHENDHEQLSTGLELISAYKKSGGNQQETYDIVLRMFVKHRDDADEQKYDLIGDWLDYISGWEHSKRFTLWNEV